MKAKMALKMKEPGMQAFVNELGKLYKLLTPFPQKQIPLQSSIVIVSDLTNQHCPCRIDRGGADLGSNGASSHQFSA
jgi:hypothetical protein